MSSRDTAYQVLALRWRPQRFADVVGQEHITRTLQNTIRQNRVGHAYLFVGPRGIGKTTSARIFAKALNCEAGMNEEPCCTCQSCLEIAASRSMDVVEIDGASHNKVEDIRELRENVNYRPARGRFKVYIIDEVHMLTNQAWNALLKTLEEPPPHVKFCFATTEPHKVLPTVVSRCQRFDLRRITVNTIVDRLAHITDSEGVPVDARALAAIARFADGGMRDALSVLDQIIAFHGGAGRTEPIAEQDVIDVFGLVSSRELGALTQALLLNEVPGVMQVIQRLADRGRDLERVYSDLLYYVRNLLMLSVDPKGEHGLVEASDSEREDMRAVLTAASPRMLPRLLEGLVAAEYSVRNALNKRVYLEAALVRLMRETHSMQVDDLIAKLNELRGTGEAIDLPPDQSVQRITLPAPADEGAKLSGASPPEVPPQSPSAPSQPSEPPEPSPATEPVPPTAPSPASIAQAPTESPTPAPQPVDEIAEGSASAYAESPHPASPPPSTPIESVPAPSGPPPVPTEPADILHALVTRAADDPDLRPFKSFLQELRPVSFIEGRLQLAYDEEMPPDHVRALQHGDNLKNMQRHVCEIVHNPEARVLLKKWIETVSSSAPRPKRKPSDEVRASVEANLFVNKVKDLFDAAIVDVRG